MMVLWEYGSITEKELGEKIHLDSGTLAPLLKRLEKQGLLKRCRMESNERKLWVCLTEEGEALREKALAVPGTVRQCIDLSTEEMIELKYLLEKALSGMSG